MNIRALAAVTLLFASLAGAACTGEGEDDASPDAPESVTSTPAELITERFDELSAVEQLDTAMTLAYLQRRFGDVAELDWANGPISSATDRISSDPELAELRPFLRFIEGDAEVPDEISGEVLTPAGEANIDVLVARALWCDEIPLPDGFVDDLASVAEIDDYELTHALGALQLISENGCDAGATVEPLRAELTTRTAGLLAGAGIGDVAVEACAILHWVGSGDLVPDDFAAAVESAQLDDGGWPVQPGGDSSAVHPTVWGLRCQLEVEHAGEVEPTSWVAGDG